MVNRHGQKNCSVYDAHGLRQTIRGIMKPVIRRFQRILCAYESLRCLDLQIWRFSCWQTTDRQTKPIALPLAAHARGVIRKSLYLCIRKSLYICHVSVLFVCSNICESSTCLLALNVHCMQSIQWRSSNVTLNIAHAYWMWLFLFNALRYQAQVFFQWRSCTYDAKIWYYSDLF